MIQYDRQQPATLMLALGVLVLLSPFRLGAVQATAPQPTDAQVAKAVAALLRREHISKHPLDDEIARRAFDNFFERLDSMKLYFTQRDIDDFAKERDGIDDQLKAGDVAFAYKVHQRFLARIDERVKLVDEILKETHDFTLSEELVINSKLLNYARDDKETRDRWRKRIKYELLVLKSGKSVGKEAADRLTRRYQNLATRAHKTTGDELLEMYIRAIAAAFDPYSGYVSATTLASPQQQSTLNLQGIGAALYILDGEVIVNRIVPGGAAEKHGKLKAGDTVIGVGQGETGEMVDVREMRLDDVVTLIRGNPGTVVRLGVVPKGTTEIIHYNIARAKIELKENAARGVILEESKKADGSPYKVGIISVPSFYRDTEAAARGAANYKSCTSDVSNILKDFGAKQVDVVVLDVRDVGSGRLNEAITLIGLFIDKGPVVQVKDSDGRVQSHNDLEAGMAWQGPLVVLCSKYSASIGESLIGAVQDYRRGLIVGDESTLGMGSVQSSLDLGSSLFSVPNPPKLGVLSVTTTQLYRPGGDGLQKRGVIPDLVLPSIRNSMTAFGDSDLKQGLDFDRVPPEKFSKLSQVTEELARRLKIASDERRSASAEFAQLLKVIEQNNLRKNQPSVPLQEQEFFANRAAMDAEKLASNSENASTDEVVKRDFYLNEVLAIATDYASLLQTPSAALPKHVPNKVLTRADKEAAERALAAEQQRLVEEKKAAKDKADGWRTWTSTAGTTTEAKFKGMVGPKVRLEKRDGTIITVPSDRLSEDDLNWIRGRR